MEPITAPRYNTEVRTFRLLWLVCLLCGFDWPGRTERLLAELARPSSENMRIDLLRRLGSIESQAAKRALAEGVTDPSPTLRAEALKALAKSADPAFAEPVRVALRDPEPNVRRAAIGALVAMQPGDTVALLTRSLADSEPAVRADSAQLLGVIGDPNAVAALSSALDDPSTEVRVAAAKALGALGDERGVGPLVSKARDGAPELREAVIDALHALGGERATTVFAQGLSDASDIVVLAAMRAIAEQDAATWLSTLRELAESPRPRVRSAAKTLVERHEKKRMHEQAERDPKRWLSALERTTKVSAEETPLLLDELEKSLPEGEALTADPLLAWLPKVVASERPRVVRLIGRSRAPSAAQALVAHLEGAPRELELALLDALHDLGVRVKPEPLFARLESRDAHVREAATRTLAHTVEEQDLEPLIKLLEAARRVLRHAAAEVLVGLAQRKERNLSEAAQRKLVRAFAAALEAPDDLLFARAAKGLAFVGSDEALRALSNAEPASDARRMALLRAASVLEGERAMRLRTVPQDAPASVRAQALFAQGLAGDPFDTTTMFTLARGDAPWPLGPAAAFVIARTGAPERARELSPSLCALLDARDPWMRTNALAGLARMPAIDCADDKALAWLAKASAPSVRNAAAHWARARLRATNAPRFRDALARCAQRDVHPLVRAQCAGNTVEPNMAALGTGVCALILADGSVVVSLPDASAAPDWPRLVAIACEHPAQAPYGRE